jgi:hypothetical protein
MYIKLPMYLFFFNMALQLVGAGYNDFVGGRSISKAIGMGGP